MHLFLKKIYRKNPFPKIYRINQCEVLIRLLFSKFKLATRNSQLIKKSRLFNNRRNQFNLTIYWHFRC